MDKAVLRGHLDTC